MLLSIILLLYPATAGVLALCPQPNSLYYRVQSPYKPSIDWHLLDSNDFHLNEGLWFAGDVISLSILEYSTDYKNYRKSTLRPSMRLSGLGRELYSCEPTRDPFVVTHRQSVIGAGGYVDKLDPIPSSLCASYAVTFDTRQDVADRIPSVDFDCAESRGAMVFHHYRFIVPPINASPIVSHNTANRVFEHFALEMVVKHRNGRVKYSTDALLFVSSMPSPSHYADPTSELSRYSIRNEMLNIFKVKNGVLHPTLADAGHLRIGITRDVVHCRHCMASGNQLTSRYWNTQKPLVLTFHQVHPRAIHGKRGIMLMLHQLSTHQKNAYSAEVAVLADAKAQHCPHGRKGRRGVENDHVDIYRKYFLDSRKPENDCHECTDLSNGNFKILALQYYHDSHVSRTFLGYEPSYDRLAGRFYSYKVWIWPRMHLNPGEYSFEIRNLEVTVRRPHSRWNKFWNARSSFTHSMFIPYTKGTRVTTPLDDQDTTCSNDSVFDAGTCKFSIGVSTSPQQQPTLRHRDSIEEEEEEIEASEENEEEEEEEEDDPDRGPTLEEMWNEAANNQRVTGTLKSEQELIFPNFRKMEMFKGMQPLSSAHFYSTADLLVLTDEMAKL